MGGGFCHSRIRRVIDEAPFWQIGHSQHQHKRTLLDKQWAEKIVGIPFRKSPYRSTAPHRKHCETSSGSLAWQVLTNVDRIQNLKAQRKSGFPSKFLFPGDEVQLPGNSCLSTDSQRSRVRQVSFQILVVDQRNLRKDPGLAAELILARKSQGSPRFDSLLY